MVIWGCGAVGLAVIMGCKEADASRIIAVDINLDKWSKGNSISILLTHSIAHAVFFLG